MYDEIIEPNEDDHGKGSERYRTPCRREVSHDSLHNLDLNRKTKHALTRIHIHIHINIVTNFIINMRNEIVRYAGGFEGIKEGYLDAQDQPCVPL